MSGWKKRTHLPSGYNSKRPRCLSTFGWKMDRVEWNVTEDISQVDCRLCLRRRVKPNEVEADVLADARKHLITRLL